MVKHVLMLLDQKIIFELYRMNTEQVTPRKLCMCVHVVLGTEPRVLRVPGPSPHTAKLFK